MIKSMTGFGRGHFDSDVFSCSVEIKAVNHRFLDMHVRLPQELADLEFKAKRWLQAGIKRGRIDLTLNIEKNEAIGLSYNPSLVRAYIDVWKQLKQEYALAGELDPIQLMRIPGVFNLESLSPKSGMRQKIEEGIQTAIQLAIADLDQMKINEGAALREDILKRLSTIAQNTAKIQALTQGALTAYQERLETRLRDLLGNTQLEPGRLLQEAAFYVERSDITEEVTRLGSHNIQVGNLLEAAEDIGKTLDFLLQEMNREANTILSKSTGLTGSGQEIANHAILIKTEVEKIREQAQNVE
jgi:uncharacterized protein (TIGR00255 family)